MITVIINTNIIKLTDYIINKKIDVVGDFSETWIIPKSYKSKEITLVKLEIMCK